jgi:hypothetical protein
VEKKRASILAMEEAGKLPAPNAEKISLVSSTAEIRVDKEN